MSVKSKHSISKKDRNGKKEKKRKIEDSEEDIESSEEELDLTKECHPIGDYIHDRAEMINQMFSVIKGNKLKAMLPPILKDCDLDQLKLSCLDQLLGMSEKRIACILEGETLETSSESDYDSDEKNGTSSGSSSERSENSHENNYIKDVHRKHRKRKGNVINEAKSGKTAKSDQENPVPEQGKTLLEILELEMRARAIRALLKQNGNEKCNEELKADEQIKNGSHSVTGEVVDLTECEDEEFQVHPKKNEDTNIDKKLSTFEEKIEKSKKEKIISPKEGEKLKKMQAELELRNKLFKKKMYRTRQQRMESEEEEKNVEKNESEVESETFKCCDNIEKVVIKQELPEPEEIVVEDPEEGEISTSEDEYPVEIKQEIIDSEPIQETLELQEPVEFELKMDEDAERITAIDNGTFVSDKNLQQTEMLVDTKQTDNVLQTQENQMNDQANEKDIFCTEKFQESERCDSEAPVEETSWRDRWLQKDGVQKLVKSSKIYAKVKKRIAEKSQKIKEDFSSVCENTDSHNSSKIEVIEGSIAEYERLLGKPQKENESGEESQQSQAILAAPAEKLENNSCSIPK